MRYTPIRNISEDEKTKLYDLLDNDPALQQLNDCDSGYDDGWNKYCHMGLARRLIVLELVRESPKPKQR